ncbi:SMI1/KNR4 family protein [Dyella sp. GSA-30]|uniref:SMI1/KNR4 family protein n=1 Tax=Dyella sp. GSA-30 TaxID=2994496 RepID=UPI002490AFBF|nr:SMI1/KNR4 family protein [Dyella sp. GSA-30]BDU20006.1 hypothetical protein DYGSA30_14630 [Dyella sp. GSA-30]
MAELVDQEQPIVDAEFRQFETLFCRSLPDSFRLHYLRDNGGSPLEDDVEAGRWGLPVHGFNPIKYGTLTIETLVEDYGDITPSDHDVGTWARSTFVPFAYDAGGHAIFMSLRDSDYGYIYLYDPDNGAIFLIERSFEMFRAQLYEATTE